MIFNPSVYEEIAFGLKQKGIKGEELKRRVEEMAERVGVAHLLNRNPIELSGGEQQRVVLGAILITEPALLLLDEPTSALDPRTTGWLMQFLEGLEVGVIVATHDLMTAYQLGDEVLVLNGGRLEFYGEMEELFSDLELLERCNLIYRYRRRCFCDSSYIKLIKEAKNGKRGY
jgi:cobalt/nickel transport system ATP-binding protein